MDDTRDNHTIHVVEWFATELDGVLDVCEVVRTAWVFGRLLLPPHSQQVPFSGVDKVS